MATSSFSNSKLSTCPRSISLSAHFKGFRTPHNMSMNGEVATESGYPALGEARSAFKAFMKSLPSQGNVVVLADGDVDGLGAAVTLEASLRRVGVEGSRILVTNVPKGANAFTPE